MVITLHSRARNAHFVKQNGTALTLGGQVESNLSGVEANCLKSIRCDTPEKNKDAERTPT